MTQETIFNEFNKQVILVIGDVMIDRYWQGKVERISPEAPVPIVNLDKIENRLGGAANVALNLKALGATPILCSVIGKDEDGELFIDILKENNLSTEGILTSDKRRTTVKSRVIAGNQHLLRMDSEDLHYIEKEEQISFIKKTCNLMDNYSPNALLMQDYNKGVLSHQVIRSIESKADATKIPIAVDPKFKNFWSYQYATLFKPNLKEVQAAWGQQFQPTLSDLKKASTEIRKRLHNKYNLITLSEKGVFVDDGEEAIIIPTHPRSIADVCGAGDTVISVATLGLALGLNIQRVAKMANLAGGQVCEKIGVVSVDKAALLNEMKMAKI